MGCLGVRKGSALSLTQPRVLLQNASNQLAAGWTALQDPASGRTYYANQTTGETTWEMPQSAPTAAKATNHGSYASSSTLQQQQPARPQSNGVSGSSTPMRMASKYGDGFVTSASHPELAQQYGNVGTR